MLKSIGAVAFATLCVTLPAQSQTLPLDTTDGITARGTEISMVEYHGSKALRVVEIEMGKVDALVMIDDVDFKDGTIEVELAAKPRADAPPNMRGFVGLAFRVVDSSHYECIYLRPTNGRSEEQIRRNHSTQYVSHPDFPWHRLRREAPGVYESYVDLVPGEWTKVRIDVVGEKAKLYVHGADQPALVVNDLKGGIRSGSVALWIALGTEAHFRNLKITAK